MDQNKGSLARLTRQRFLGSLLLLNAMLIVGQPPLVAAAKVPGRPIILKITSYKQTSSTFEIRVKFELPSSPNSTISSSLVKVSNKSCTTKGRFTTCSVRDVPRGQTLNVSARSRNKFGYGSSSLAVKYKAGAKPWQRSTSSTPSNTTSPNESTPSTTTLPNKSTPSTTTLPNKSEQAIELGMFTGTPDTYLSANIRNNFHIAQSFRLEKSMTLNTARLHLDQTVVVKDKSFLELPWDNNNYEMFFSGSLNGISVTSTFWRYELSGNIPNVAEWPFSGQPSARGIDLRSGWTKAGQGTTTVDMPIGSGFTEIPLQSPIMLKKGNYLVVFKFKPQSSNLTEARFSAQVTDKYTLGGYSHDQPAPCEIMRHSPVAAGTGAYEAVEANENVDPNGRIPSQYWFVVMVGKSCRNTPAGHENNIWNPTNLQLQLFGIPAEPVIRPPWSTDWANLLSTSAMLPQSSYSSLACDPYDSRLAGIQLPNGYGPEARAAAACTHLEWIEQIARPTRPISVLLSPGISTEQEYQLRTAAVAGDRLFGRFAIAPPTYLLLNSIDSGWSCTTGQDLLATYSVGRGVQSPWTGTRNSGCAGAPTSYGSWQPYSLGQNGDLLFTWSLAPATQPSASNSYWWTFGSHEFVHSIAMQRASSVIQNSEVSLGAWWGEGQAQYLGFSAGELNNGVSDTRSLAMSLLKSDMAATGTTQISIESLESAWGNSLIYSAGYFAYEYMLAHYGLENTFKFWSLWNSEQCTQSRQICWRNKSQDMFGISSETLLSRIDNYINNQIR